MKSYLLGILDDQEADRLEERYFRDAEFFDWVQEIEADLIWDYLDGRLPDSQRASFERRYFSVPELKKRFEAMRAQPRPPRQVTLGKRWQIAATVALLVLAAGAFQLYWPNRGKIAGGSVSSFRPPPEAPLLVVNLSPGITMGQDSGQSTFIWPRRGSVRLLLELPGRRTPLEAQVKVRIVDASGRHPLVWASPHVVSTTTSTGQMLNVAVESVRLAPGDYLAEVTDGNGRPVENYLFRVGPPR